jgi:hypothetical protein
MFDSSTTHNQINIIIRQKYPTIKGKYQKMIWIDNIRAYFGIKLFNVLINSCLDVYLTKQSFIL